MLQKELQLTEKEKLYAYLHLRADIILSVLESFDAKIKALSKKNAYQADNKKKVAELKEKRKAAVTKMAYWTRKAYNGHYFDALAEDNKSYLTENEAFPDLYCADFYTGGPANYQRATATDKLKSLKKAASEIFTDSWDAFNKAIAVDKRFKWAATTYKEICVKFLTGKPVTAEANELGIKMVKILIDNYRKI